MVESEIQALGARLSKIGIDVSTQFIDPYFCGYTMILIV